MDQKSIPMWRRLIVGKEKSWVVFAHGTCVVVANGAGQPADCAIQVMKEYGPVYAACPAADFTTLKLSDDSGWLVGFHHPDILTYVTESEAHQQTDLQIGLLGRTKRDLDAKELQVIHIEDTRCP